MEDASSDEKRGESSVMGMVDPIVFPSTHQSSKCKY